MVSQGEHQALGGWRGIAEVMHGMDGHAEGGKAEDERTTEGGGPSGSPPDATEAKGGQEEERRQEQTRVRVMTRE
jgi:hypothetical protein